MDKKAEKGGFWMFVEDIRLEPETPPTENTEKQEKNTKTDSYNFYPDQSV